MTLAVLALSSLVGLVSVSVNSDLGIVVASTGGGNPCGGGGDDPPGPGE